MDIRWFAHNLQDDVRSEIGQRRGQLRALIAAVRPHFRDLRGLLPHLPDPLRSPSRSGTDASWTRIDIGDPCGSTVMGRLRPLIFLPASDPAGPPLSVVATDWRSIAAAAGSCERPSCSRAGSRRASSIRSKTPVFRHAYSSFVTVRNGGNHFGIARHWHPVPSMNWMALNTSRGSGIGLRPILDGGGRSGAITAHSAALTSASKRSRGRVYCF